MLVKLWDTKTGKVLFTMDKHRGKIFDQRARKLGFGLVRFCRFVIGN